MKVFQINNRSGTTTTKTNRLKVVAIVIPTTLLIVFGGTALFIAFVLRPKGDWTFPRAPTPDIREKWAVTDTVFTEKLDDIDFCVYSGFILWVTTVQMGFGLEYFVWSKFLQTWDDERETMWRFAQFCFPLLTVTSIGLALSGNYTSLPILVIAMWKFGFPETIMYLYLGLFARKNGPLKRLSDFLNGIGTVSHHGAASFLVCMLLAHVVPPSRYIIETAFILIIQHWFVLMAYISPNLYSIVEILIEVWFEWTIFSTFQHIYVLHWTAGLGTGVFLVAHWLYLAAAAVDLFTDKDLKSRYEIETTHVNAITRGTAAFIKSDKNFTVDLGGETVEKAPDQKKQCQLEL